MPDTAARHPQFTALNYPQQGNPQHAPIAQQAAIKVPVMLPGAAANVVPAVIETAIAASFAIRTIVRLLGLKVKSAYS